MPQQTHVLLAHFDPAERSRIEAVLLGAGAKVTAVADGTSASRLAAAGGFDLVLATCMLPGVSGFEIARALESAGSGTPVVLLSDVDDPYVRARARHVGAKRVLFGTPVAANLTELLGARWDAVDPLSLSSRDPATAKNDLLFRDLLAAGEEGGAGDDGSLLAKVTDKLTGLVNRDYLALKIEEECKRASRYGHDLALLVAEIAGYDQLIERHGRSAGDEAVLEAAGVFLCESRDVDVAGRAGPARFHLLLPATPVEGARTVAQRIHESLAGRKLSVGEQEVPLVVRLGLAVLCAGDRRAASDLVRDAEADLATAQLSGDGRGAFVRGGTPVEPLPPPPQAKAGPARKPR